MTAASERDNLDLAATAQEIADGAQAGSIDHAAAASVAITCATTRDAAHARAVLDGLTPDEVRQAALELFDRLAAPAE
ncbi:hypothetical protein [Planomonospora venezuelensis]|uniref:Uncharacterized protein n=1 Tax=Planomonospora venezuelensis TaxID=1999 RepID=A0A841D929_PLAVE|nr:hypothetical protein [Planomonospora venezuelensis]MBB5966701.1 hypothetical protein [Planomonospora venezuelensis]GIN00329.1 hypothetical protein Pve01_19870 [Planomonospora venezuelensis]